MTPLPTMEGLDSIGAVVAGRAAGTFLSEPDAQRITAKLGIAVPPMVVAASADEAAQAALAGSRVVVKVVGPAHKTERGGVQVVPNDPTEIAAAAAGVVVGGAAEGILVAEFVEHDPGLEILAGVRWTDAFGPVVTIGVGGVAAEFAAAPAVIAPAVSHSIGAILAAAPGCAPLFSGRRGTAPAAGTEQLAGLVRRLLALGVATMPQHLVEFEMNPIVFTRAGPMALDALAVVGGPRAAESRPRPAGGIARQLHPHSIAVIGVSTRTMNPARVMLRNVLTAGFPPDRVVVIKPGTTEVDGCRCVPDVASLPGPVDLLIVAIDAGSVPELVEQVVAEGGARSMILIPGGLGEAAGTTAAADRIREALRTAEHPPVVTGPNSMGIRSRPGNYDATFIPPERMTPLPVRDSRPGGIGEAVHDPGRSLAMVSQSGAFTLSRLDRMPWLQPRYVITVGNQIDLTIGDYLEHLAADPSVEVVACYLEGLQAGDGDRILRAAQRIRGRGGVVVWYRGGRTAAGAQAATTHTAAIATDDRIARALARTAGVIAAESLDDFDDLLRLSTLFHGRALTGRRVGVVTNAGFEAVAAADAGALTIGPFATATTVRLEKTLAAGGFGAIAAIGNPVDLTPMADDAAFAAAVEAVLDDPRGDVAVVGCVPFSPSLGTTPDANGLTDRLIALAGHPKPWAVVVDAGRLYDPVVDRLEAAGIPVMRTMDRAVRLIGQYLDSRLG